MTHSRDLAARHAWQGAFSAALLNAVGMPIDFFLARNIPTMPIYPYAMSVLVGIGLIVFLLIRRQRATVRLGSAVFLVNMVTILVALWITSGYWATTGRPWTPFQANKLGALAVAMLAPQLGVGLVSIAGLAATAIGKVYFIDPEIQRGFPVGEPWFVLIYALFGAVLLIYRLRGLALEREMLRMQAEAAAAEQLARTFLRLRNYTNTPLQTIAFTTELLRAKHEDLKHILDRLERAGDKLTELSHALNRYENAHKWSPGEESLEVAIMDERMFGSHLRRP
jgi:signal transduction histidine kinase